MGNGTRNPNATGSAKAHAITGWKVLVAVTRALKLLVGLFERIIRGEDI